MEHEVVSRLGYRSTVFIYLFLLISYTVADWGQLIFYLVKKTSMLPDLGFRRFQCFSSKGVLKSTYFQRFRRFWLCRHYERGYTKMGKNATPSLGCLPVAGV